MISCLPGWSVAQRWQQGWKKKSGLGSETIGGRTRIWSWLWTLKKVFISCKKRKNHPNKPNLKKRAALNANYLSFEDQQAAKCARPLLMLSLQEDFMDWWSYLTNSTTTLKYCQYLTWPFIWSSVMLFHGLFVMPSSLGKTLSPSCPWLSKNWCQILTLLFRNKGLGNIVFYTYTFIWPHSPELWKYPKMKRNVGKMNIP